MWIKLDILIYSTLDKELGYTTVIFCTEKKKVFLCSAHRFTQAYCMYADKVGYNIYPNLYIKLFMYVLCM